MCLWLCTASVHNTTQNSSDNLLSYLQTNIIAQMLSIGGEGVAESRAMRQILLTTNNKQWEVRTAGQDNNTRPRSAIAKHLTQAFLLVRTQNGVWLQINTAHNQAINEINQIIYLSIDTTNKYNQWIDQSISPRPSNTGVKNHCTMSRQTEAPTIV